MKRDKYYGQVAKTYNNRKNNPKWDAEHNAVADMLKTGPVLDVPCGTGRFFKLYRARGLEYLGADISQDMLDIAKREDKTARLEKMDILKEPRPGYATAVCIRLLQWLYPAEVKALFENLTESADEIIFSVRLGPEGHEHDYTSYTHTEETVLTSLNGYVVTDRRKISERKNCVYWVYHCRRPVYADVQEWFRDRRNGTIELLLSEFAPRVGLDPFKPSNSVRCEYWTAGQHKALIDRQAGSAALALRRCERRWRSERMRGRSTKRH